ncbi:hypothetical protein DBR06_SOUSAS810126, partial [Sousa chinensis]
LDNGKITKNIRTGVGNSSLVVAH